MSLATRVGWRVALILCALGADVPAYGGQGPEQFFGRTVTAVAFQQEQRPVTLPALTALVEVKVGEPLSPEGVRTSIDRLARHYDDVRPEAAETPGGVAVTFHLVPRHPIDQLQVTGDTGIAADELRRQLLQRYGGTMPPSARLDEVVAQATQILRLEGYLNARAEARTIPRHDPEGATLVVTASAGTISRILRTDVEGRPPFTTDAILARTGATPGAAYRELRLDTELAGIQDDLIDRGYYEARAGHRIEQTANGVVVTITVDTGPLVELRVDPADVLPGDQETLIPIRLNGSADQDLLEDAEARIESRLRNEGYRVANVTFTADRTPDLVVITFKIERGPRHFVDRIDVPTSLILPQPLLLELLGVRAGDVLRQGEVEAGAIRVLDEYRRRGYYEAESVPSYEYIVGRGRPNESWVILQPGITEGPRGVVSRISFTFEGAHQVAEAELRELMRSREGQPYVDLDRLADLAALRTLYEDRGFRPEIALEAEIVSEGRDVRLAARITEGPQVRVGAILVVNNEHVSTEKIRERLGLSEGAPLGAAALREAQTRVRQLGFRTVTVTAEPGLPGDPERPVIVSVEEAPAVNYSVGAGVEGGTTPRSVAGGGFRDQIEFSPRMSFEVSRRYLWGGNSVLSLFTRISAKPTNAPGDPARDGRGFGFAEYRVTGLLRSRYLWESETDLLVGLTAEQAERTTFNVSRRAANAELLHRLTPRIGVTGRYTLDFSQLSNERILPGDQLLIDRIFPQVRLSILSAGLLFDRRNDPVRPSRGTFVVAESEVALRALGSEVGYLKSFFEVSWFRGLAGSARTVLAVRGQLGMAHGFLRTVVRVDEDGQPILGPGGEPLTDNVQDLPISKRFFTGGSNSVRGFQLDRLGVPEVLNPNGLSLGGNGMIVANVELRRVLAGKFSGVAFLDGGNVFADATDIRLSRIRGAAGVGVRYDSPLGPIRLDFGFKLNRLTVDNRTERAWEYHLSILEAF